VASRIIVYDNHVFLTVPYWYKGQKAEQLFGYIKAYIKIIRETAEQTASFSIRTMA
jgi:hypothetical protein